MHAAHLPNSLHLVDNVVIFVASNNAQFQELSLARKTHLHHASLDCSPSINHFESRVSRQLHLPRRQLAKPLRMPGQT